MTEFAKKSKSWTKPVVQRLGEIHDVSGKEVVKTQAVNTKS